MPAHRPIDERPDDPLSRKTTAKILKRLRSVSKALRMLKARIEAADADARQRESDRRALLGQRRTKSK